MAPVQETFAPKLFAASGGVVATQCVLGGFLAATAGSIKINLGFTGAGATIVETTPVVAGQFVPLPFSIPDGGCYLTLTGGATGTLAYLA